jgi:predicted alpha/beta superfamily hydrolase
MIHPDPGPDEIFLPVETRLLQSQFVDQTFKVEIALPPRARGDPRPLPTVYVTDGNAVFDMFRSLCWLMQRGERQWPPFILVAIGYPGETPVAGNLLRCRDLTFPGYPDVVTANPQLRHYPAPRAGTPSFGGAEAFQQFLGRELFPSIERDFPVLPDRRTYFGHSMGGAFGLFTLATRPELFGDYVISSPVLAYDGVTPSGIEHRHDDFLKRRFAALERLETPYALTRLVMSVGLDEDQDEGLANWQMTKSYASFVKSLRARGWPNFEVFTREYEGRNHLSVWPVAFMDGITKIFGEGPAE